MVGIPLPSRPRRAPWGPATTGASQPEGVRLIPVDQASAAPRPNLIGKTYLELSYDARDLEQEQLFAAEGDVQSRKDMRTARALAYEAEQSMASVERAKVAADRAAERSEEAADALSPYIRRKATSPLVYKLCTCGLLVGDVAGLAGAAIALGELPELAVAQALSAGVATVTAGLAATQLRHLQQAAERQTDDLPASLEPYRHLFNGARAVDRLQAAVFGVAALIGILVAAGIFALRTSIEGPLSGITFGGLAAAIALASFVNSWYHADAIADLVESTRHVAERADRRHRRLSGATVVKRNAGAAASEQSTISEYTHRAKAAAAHLDAVKYRALLASPDVVGHGPGPVDTPPSPTKRVRSA